MGRGHEIVCHCIDSLRFLVIGVRLWDIFGDMGSWLYKVNNEGQLRWLGPEKGVIGEEGGDSWGITAVTCAGMAVAGIVNSLWDLRGRLEGKPVWKILVDLSPEEQIKLIDFT